nr:M28 family peptidase [Pseudopedobacter sp.]
MLHTGINAQTNPPALSAIKEADLKKDIFELAGDAFRGRRGGSLDEMRAAVWVAQKAKEAGLKPAGEDGTFFQFFNIHRTRIASDGNFSLNNQKLTLWKDVWPSQPLDLNLTADVQWLNSIADTTMNLKDKVVALKITAPNPLPAVGMSLWGYRYTASAMRQQSQILQRKGVKAIIFVADDVVKDAIAFIGHNFEEGLYLIDGMNKQKVRTPGILISQAFETELKKGNAKLTANFKEENFDYPSVNVIAKAEGTDKALKNEYVLFSGHHDHDGVGPAIKGDSIWNGADDNASVTVAMLAIGRAWVVKPGKRSALFVWHGAEERGLLGSRWYVNHPTVDKSQIIAVLNGDMIGRNNPDSAALLGSIPPHRNSTELVNMAMKANENLTHFKVDFSWDEATHPEFWYFRSDHLPYAQAGIPAIFFTTLLHPDYHTPKDEPSKSDIAKLKKMTDWMYGTGWVVSETLKKPAVDGEVKR